MATPQLALEQMQQPLLRSRSTLPPNVKHSGHEHFL